MLPLNASRVPEHTDSEINARILKQTENKVDIGITASIRKSVVDTNMSTNAQNVKIITQDGNVTLRGPVKTQEEKKRIEEIARNVAGVKAVDSQLEVDQSETGATIESDPHAPAKPIQVLAFGQFKVGTQVAYERLVGALCSQPHIFSNSEGRML